MKAAKIAGIVALIVILTISIPAGVYANPTSINALIKSKTIKSNPDISLEKHVMQVWLHRGYAEVESVYQLHNTGEAQECALGVPEEINTKASLLYGIYNFDAFVDGDEVDTKAVKAKKQLIGSLRGTINWHVHTMFFAKDQKRIIVHRYWVRLNPWDSKLAIPLVPAAAWKNKVGEAYYAVYLMGDLSDKEIMYPPGYGEREGKHAVLPDGFKAGKNRITWSFTGYEPRRDLEIKMFPDKERSVPKVSSSSMLVDNGKRHIAGYAVDGDPDTAWGIVASDKKEWINLSFDNKRWVRALMIIPGFATSESMFKYYNRVKEATLRFSDGSSQRIKLKDALEVHYVKLKPVRTEYVKLEIDDTYKGIYPYMTYVSEVEFAERATRPKIDPSEWKVGLNQISKPVSPKPERSIVDTATIAATAMVFLLIVWQVISAIRLRKRARQQ